VRNPGTVFVWVTGVAGLAIGFISANVGALTKRVVAAIAMLTVLLKREFIVCPPKNIKM
jgi:tetrahydromethanopterin S-methyltransferase subunit F